MEDDNSSEQDFEQLFDPQILFTSINRWERESIAKVQIIAQNARYDLQQIIDEMNERLVTMYNTRMIHLRSWFETNNLLNQWMEQLKQLQATILSSFSIYLTEHKRHSTIDILKKFIVHERFSTVIGNTTICDNGRLAKHTADDWNYEYLLGERLYFEGRHMIRFHLKQNGIPYNIFFGCISSQAIHNRISIQSSFTVGWFGNNQIYQHGIRHDDSRIHHYNSNEFATDDILHLTIDCDRKQIELIHEESKKKHLISVNIIKAPFPWQLLVVLTDKDDCVKIISRESSYD